MNNISESANSKSADLEVFFTMLDVPIYCNLLWSDRQAAVNCPKGDIKLAFCPNTGLITNVAFDPNKLDYDQDYENSLHYSPKFQQYAQALAEDLVKRHQLKQKNIIEIGCGKGDFLISLCELGDNRGVGFDPSYVPRNEHEPWRDRVQFIQDFYSQRYQTYSADFICCRHTLEHVSDPDKILQPLRKAIGDRLETVIFFEVPNAIDTFRRLAVWDIIYEHCCYFVPASLVQAFVNNGFEVKRVNEVFNGQFLCLEALPVSSDRGKTKVEVEPLDTIQEDIATFTNKFNNKLAFWSDKLAHVAQKSRKAVAWGAGSKGVTFLNLLKEHDTVEYIVDLNPRKQGKYVAGSGQEIVAPEFLTKYQPELIIIMNPIYETEIRQLTRDLGLNPEFMCV
jgi:SAM-dependent methyltransferase